MINRLTSAFYKRKQGNNFCKQQAARADPVSQFILYTF